MRIAILHFLNDEKNAHRAILKTLQETAQANGHDVAVFSAKTDPEQLRLTMYEYITIIVPSSLFIGSSLPERFAHVLASAGMILGKKASALVVQSGLSSKKTVRTLMRAMEREGLKIDYFDVVKNAEHARCVGKKLG